MREWIDPNEQEPHGHPYAAHGLIALDGVVRNVTLASHFLVLDSLDWSREVGERLLNDIKLGRMMGGLGDKEYSRIANLLLSYAEGKTVYVPDYIPILIRANIRPLSVKATTEELRAYARKLLALSDTNIDHAPDFILDVSDSHSRITVIHKLAHVANHSAGVESSIVSNTDMIHMAVAIMKRALDGNG